MPIGKKWSPYTKENVKKLPKDMLGVYEIGNRTKGEVYYIGEGKIRDRLLSHVSNGSEPVVGADGFRFEETGNKPKAVKRQNELLEKFKQDNDQLPKYNQKSKS